jgi:hypothetical protein
MTGGAYGTHLRLSLLGLEEGDVEHRGGVGCVEAVKGAGWGPGAGRGGQGGVAWPAGTDGQGTGRSRGVDQRQGGGMRLIFKNGD